MFWSLLSSPSWCHPFSNWQTPTHPSKPNSAGASWAGGVAGEALLSAPPPYRPTSSSSRSLARGRSHFQMSMVKSVLLLLKMGQRGHESGHHHSDHQPPQAWGDRGRCDPCPGRAPAPGSPPAQAPPSDAPPGPCK